VSSGFGARNLTLDINHVYQDALKTNQQFKLSGEQWNAHLRINPIINPIAHLTTLDSG